MPPLPKTAKVSAILPSKRKALPVQKPPPSANDILYIALDPGASGGVAGILRGQVLFTNPLPDSELECWQMIRELSTFDSTNPDNIRFGIEWINPGYKGSGKSDVAKLYGSYMQLRGFLTAAGMPFETLNPQVWQKTLGLTRLKTDNSGKWKKKLKAKAQQLFPRLEIWQKAQVHQLRVSDAILMANYLYNLRKD